MTTYSPEYKSTYVLDAESGAEMARLNNLDLIVTKAMGECLPRQSDPQSISAIIDIASGPGGWALEVAFQYSEIKVIGIDISQTMILYAQMRAKTQHLDNAHFLLMDATQPLDFPDNSFDLVNARFLVGFMLPHLWTSLLRECWRITRPGGAIRLTEGEGCGMSTSPALEKFNALGVQAFHNMGRLFSPGERHLGIQPRLSSLLRDAGYQHIQMTAHVLDYSAGAKAHNGWYQNNLVSLKLSIPFLVKWGVARQEELELLYQQALEEMKAPDFCGIFSFLSVYAEKPL
jgi:ubiquinone/menaquinone biosynthesis C-methylase UbiE